MRFWCGTAIIAANCCNYIYLGWGGDYIYNSYSGLNKLNTAIMAVTLPKTYNPFETAPEPSQTPPDPP